MTARAAVVCALVLGMAATAARADDRRPVAVIVLSAEDDGLGKLADDVTKALVNHVTLAPLTSDASSLADSIPNEDAEHLKVAAGELKFAGEAIDAFEFGAAADAAKRGKDALVFVAPDRVAHDYADLALALGRAQLGNGDGKAADASFALVHALDPDLTLGDGYLPEVVAAFDKAHASDGKRDVEIRGTGRVWVDGRALGPAPGTFSLAVGRHLVQLAAIERNTRGLEVMVGSDKPLVIDIPDDEATRVEILHRARAALVAARDPVERAGAITYLASLVGVKDAVLLSRDEVGAVRYEIWSDEQTSPATPLTDKDKPSVILDIIEPPKPAPIVIHKFYPIPIPVPTPWWQKPRYLGPIAGGVLAVVVGGFLLAHHEGTFSSNPVPGFVQP